MTHAATKQQPSEREKQEIANEPRIAVIGLGYVGLPVALAFARKFPTVGFDVSSSRLAELRSGRDMSGEVDVAALQHSSIEFTGDERAIAECTVFIVTVPTPVDEANQPDLRRLTAASETVARVLKHGDLVIYESTVYPGATEEQCVPILESGSGLVLNDDFLVGYSPERINPGDRAHRLDNVVKVVAGSNALALDRVDMLYSHVAKSGRHRAANIRTAEMAKIIENTQRDLNIALMNEVALICNKLDIDTGDVLDAANTKWNFLRFTPGLVGGHCVGVDPYYLTYKAREIGHEPEVILAGRRINNAMPSIVAARITEMLLARRSTPANARALVLGVAFKQDCPDVRNSKSVDLIEALQSKGMVVDAFDPVVSRAESAVPLSVRLREVPARGAYDVVVLAVAHREILDLGNKKIQSFGREHCVLFDVQRVLPREVVSGRL